MKRVLAVFLFLVGTALPTTSNAIPISSTDLWDISQSSVVDANSGVLNYRSSYRSDIRNMFGGAFGTVDVGNTLFKDYNLPGLQGGNVAPGFTHYVEWHTPSAVTLRSFSLHAFNEGMTRRAFSRFALYTGAGGGGPWTSIYDTGPGYTYGPGALDLSIDVTPVVAQFFRAEFVQASWTDGRAVGPRIQELDGFNTFLDGSTGGGRIPEPSTLALFGIGFAGLAFMRQRRNPA